MLSGPERFDDDDDDAGFAQTWRNEMIGVVFLQKMSAMQADLSCQSPAERQKAAESPVKIDQLREFEVTWLAVW